MNKIFVQCGDESDEPMSMMYLNRLTEEIYERVDRENDPGVAAHYTLRQFREQWDFQLNSFRLELIYND